MWPMYRYVNLMTREVVTEQVTAAECWKCGRERPDLAHAVFEYVAALLAEPLRAAFDAHLDECGCGHNGVGIAHCDAAMVLWDLLPDGDRVIIA